MKHTVLVDSNTFDIIFTNFFEKKLIVLITGKRKLMKLMSKIDNIYYHDLLNVDKPNTWTLKMILKKLLDVHNNWAKGDSVRFVVEDAEDI